MVEKTLECLEMLRINLYRDLVEAKTYPYQRVPIKHKNYFQPLAINGYPVFQFRYEGAMPLYDKENRELIQLVRDYYFQATLEMYELPEINIQFKKAVLIIQHIFPDKIIRDLDNRNRKFVIDAIRLTGLINDDNFMNLSIFEEGYVKENAIPYVNVFLLNKENFQDFLTYSKKLALEEFDILKNFMSFEEFKQKYKERLEEKKRKSRSEKSILDMNIW